LVWLLNDRVGVFKALLMSLGVIQEPVVWLGDRGLAMGAIIVSVVWKTQLTEARNILTRFGTLSREQIKPSVVLGRRLILPYLFGHPCVKSS
jgi:ABC-type sugar transport system permease subunit